METSESRGRDGTTSKVVTARRWRADSAAGWIAIASGVIAAVGVVFLLLLYALFLTPLKDVGLFFGGLNDVLIALQYFLTIPVALSLRRILRIHAPAQIDIATFVGIASMIAVVLLQMAFVLGALTLRQQVIWAGLAIVAGIGFWLVTTGVVARATGRFPNSLRMSLLAVPYLGYPIWALWLGRHLLRD